MTIMVQKPVHSGFCAHVKEKPFAGVFFFAITPPELPVE